VRSLRSALVVGTVAGIVAVLAAGSLPAPADAVSPRVPNRLSGLRWASGAYVPQQGPADIDAFGTWRRARVDVAMTFTGHSSWADITDPGWLYESWRAAPQTLVISSAPFPDGKKYSLRACGRGDYDAQWRRFGANAQAGGMASRTVVRLAWEFNGSWVGWAARRPAEFVACWRRVFRAAESRAPGLRWDWTVNRGVGDALADARRAWPGKRYVDIVGIDTYDGWPAVKSAAGWNKQYAGRYGLKFWAAFARSKGKRLSVPEWGLYPGTAWAGHNGGDNAYYIRKMFSFFSAQRGALAYETYFNDVEPEHASDLRINPRGGAEYRRQVVRARR
jgi:Glycosyl hydrolase family 26